MSNRRPDLLKIRVRSTTLATPLPTTKLHARVWQAAKRAAARTAASVARYRDANAEAVLYQELSKFSDAELERRGFARGDLHRHVRASSGQ
jgi:hypothetical protein